MGAPVQALALRDLGGALKSTDALIAEMTRPQALTMSDKVSAVAVEFANDAQLDAINDAEDELRNLRDGLRHLREMSAAEVKLFYGSDLAWKQAIERVSGAEWRKKGQISLLRLTPTGPEPRIDIEQIASKSGGVRWVGG